MPIHAWEEPTSPYSYGRFWSLLIQPSDGPIEQWAVHLDLRSEDLAVIGAGVIGLSVAHELATAGHDVTVIADADTPDTVSAVAAAVWFPYRSEQSPEVDHLLERSLVRFRELATISDAGIEQRMGTVVERVEKPDRSWTRILPDAVDATPEQLPPGALSGVRATVPLIVIPVFLRWLRDQVTARGVGFEHRTVTDLSELTLSSDAAAP